MKKFHKITITALAIFVTLVGSHVGVSALSSESGKLKTGTTYNGDWGFYQAIRRGNGYYTEADIKTYGSVTVWVYPPGSNKDNYAARRASGTANSVRHISAGIVRSGGAEHEYSGGGPAY
ncbi:MAG: hypothetical protein RR565_06970 [Erysipelothrix sp.]